ncbi:uncharacterized protein EHS24_005287 [Apiotrichum porosum]|nr:uncharacterized protein EHS24_005287 [Apiotrichum porosum]RSH76711.1 hypothetical protein EHS24_005287 [Apiotrichum porosum]
MSSQADSSSSSSTPRLGCLTCRRRKVKCNLEQPTCAACNRLQKECVWQDMSAAPPPRQPRRPNDSACEQCRTRKLKCEGDPQRGACTRCQATSTACDWSSERVVRQRTSAGPSTKASTSTPSAAPLASTAGPSIAAGPSFPNELSQAETEAMIDLYFETVHHFGFLTFIHEMRFKRLLSRGKAPRDLTMAMVANVLRFTCDPTPENLARGDALVDGIIASLLPRVLQGFGVIQLMTLILVSHYEGQRGKTGSRFLLSALCVRMVQLMSLNTLDHTFPAKLPESHLSPLFTYEALRRVAWSVFFQDSTLDGGRYGSSLVDLGTFRIQLPCNEQSFLGNDNSRTESIFAPPSEHTAMLGLSAYLIRATHLRRRALNAVFRITHHDLQVPEVQADLAAIEATVKEFVNSMPARYHFTSDNAFLHRKRLPAFLLLHLLLHKLYIIVTMMKLALYRLDPAFSHLIPQVRHQRISHATAVSGILAEGLKQNTTFDLQAFGEAYYALEILLFEPRRLVATDSNADAIAAAIPPLLALLRIGGRRSEVIRVLHVEAVHRLLRCDYLPLLDSFDLEAFGSEYQPGQDEAEFDFRDFRFAKIERLRSVSRPTWQFRDEPLLEYHPDPESGANSAVVSPRLDASHVNSSNANVPSTLDLSPLGGSTLDGGDSLSDPW